ncbi:NAD(P)-dependent oxidoreductase [Synechococcus sp. UW179A]|uniref:NAD(P)-dependent oxidoreductase n=1 Tax=Synechococcus sp. UW179A TaxID=2575510 RepID=UPI00352C8051
MEGVDPMAMLLNDDFRNRSPDKVRVVVFGATGYIGRFVVKELITRGYNVVAFARDRSGVGGRQDQESVKANFPGAEVRFGDVTNSDSLARHAFDQPVDVVISCLASRTGGRKDSWAIDYQATLNTYRQGKKAGLSHFVLLSAICVQKPLLEFQKAKLALEAELRDGNDVTYSIVRPTAFFKSLGAQVESCRKGAPYVMFGDGELASCKPISESDLASYLSDCVVDQDKINQILPIGGPGEALSARQQGELLFKALGKKTWMISLPIALMDLPVGCLEFLSGKFPSLEDTAEFGRIGRYYAGESMLVWDEQRQQYDSAATPSYGSDTLEQFFERVVRDGMDGQDLGDAALF